MIWEYKTTGSNSLRSGIIQDDGLKGEKKPVKQKLGKRFRPDPYRLLILAKQNVEKAFPIALKVVSFMLCTFL